MIRWLRTSLHSPGARPISALLVLTLIAVLIGWPVTRAAAAVERCADLYNITKPTPAEDELPGFAPPGATEPDYPLGIYTYQNPGENVRDLQLPADPDLLATYGTDPRGKIPGTLDHVYAAWNRYIARKKTEGKPPLPWEKWLNQYVPNMGNNNRGKAFEQYAAETIGLGGDWLCQAQIPGSPADRVFDAVNQDQRIAYEFKSGNSLVKAQLLKDAQIAKATGYRIQYVFGSKPRRAVLRALRNAGLNDPYTLEATPAMTNRAAPAQGPASQILEPDPAAGPSEGPFNDLANGSGDDQNQANDVEDADQDVEDLSGNPDQAAIRPGGIDFSTMQLRYVSQDPDGAGLQYSFQTDDNPEDTPAFGGLQDARLTSDAMFTWLALDPSTFWVNLNPDQPDKVVDPRLAATDAGRILLTSDLTLKHVVSALEVPGPDNPTGNEFWKQQQGTSEQGPCTGTYRVWIEPDIATVRDTGSQLYVLGAPLKVEAQRIHLNAAPNYGKPCDLPQAIQDHNLTVLQNVVVPQAQTLVNTDPRFADLRRVYYSRVVAQWIRDHDAVKPGAFHKIIDSGDVTRWPARTPWNPALVYADYLKSYQDGDASFTITYPINGVSEQLNYNVGGVLFANAPHTPIPEQTFNTTYKTLPATVTQSQQAPVHYAGTDASWLGGGPTPTQPGPGPAPTTTPTQPANPTPPPTPPTNPAAPTHQPPELAQSGPTLRPEATAALLALAAGTTLLTLRRPRRPTRRRRSR